MSERDEHVWRLYSQAIDLPAGERAAFLDEECGADSRTRHELERMLVAYEREDGELPRVVPALESTAAEPALAPGDDFAGFRIVRHLASGGMGQVYEAEQAKPRRRVALKVLPRERRSDDVFARFQRESELLGHLDHSGIARLFEARTAETTIGPQPYLAMEYIEGEELDVYANTHGLDLRERLRLVQRIAEAVDHAHGRGVIHRDLKPANVLVDAAGNPKVLDFGVARALDEDISGASVHTAVGQLVGTLAYMSPEQAACDPASIEIRTDVYALGALAYKLLAGTPPVDVRGVPPLEAAQRIQEEPPKRLGSVRRECAGDVETIVHRALEKERGRRYASARELADDIGRFLDRLPIHARPPSAAYRLRRWAQRHPAAAVLVAVGVLALPFAIQWGSTVGAAWEFEALERERAFEERLGRAFLYLGELDADAAAAEFEGALAERRDSPEAVTGLVLALLRLNRTDEALAVLTRARAVVRAAPALGLLRADALNLAGRASEAEAAFEAVPEADDALSFYVRGTRELQAAAVDRSRARFVEAARLLRRAIFASPAPRAIYYFEFAQASWRAADAEGARDAISSLERHWPDSPTATYWTGCCLETIGEGDAALAKFEAAKDGLPDFPAVFGNLGNALSVRRRWDEAIECHQRVVELAPERADGHYNLGLTHFNRGQFEGDRRDFETAGRHLAAAVERRPGWGRAHKHLAGALIESGRPADAIPHARLATEYDPEDPQAHRFLGVASYRVGDWVGTETALRERLRLSPRALDTYGMLGEALQAQDELDELVLLYEQATDRHPEVPEFPFRLAIAYRWVEDWSGALEALRTAREVIGDGEVPWAEDLARLEADTEEQVRLDELLPAILAGEQVPEDGAESFRFAKRCYLNDGFQQASIYFRLGLASDPASAITDWGTERYDAACSAARCAAGGGPDELLDADSRLEWARQAQAWLAEELAYLDGPGRARFDGPSLLETLDHWRVDPDLVSIRNEPSLVSWPDDLRDACRAVWERVDELRETLR